MVSVVVLVLHSEEIVNMLNNFLLILCTLGLIGCASSGGGASSPDPYTPPPSNGGSTTPTQPYQTIDPIVYNYDLGINGNTTATYQSGEYQDENQFARTDKYKIAHYAFWEIIIDGQHQGNNYQGQTPTPGTWSWDGIVNRADLNGDGFEDILITDHFVGNYENQPRSYLHAFLNDGNGGFTYAPDLIQGSNCIGYGVFEGKTDPNHECGFTNGWQRPIVGDFNGDGIDDYFRTGNYFLSNDGKLSRQNNKLPSWMMEYDSSWAMGGPWTHDNYASDVEGDGDLDIFGNYGPGSMRMLINDGTGGFTTNYNFYNVQGMSANAGASELLWNTTAAIGDFDGDGFGDVAVGWMNPNVARESGFGEIYENSAGAVFWNDGNNYWNTLPWTELPDNYYGANGNANDMEVMDINGDGLLDIVLASTKRDPYYNGRAVQFFLNNGDKTFSDVTSSYNPNVGYYADGIPGSDWWNGEGELAILDFDGDGDLDIVDQVNNTYVLLNNGEGVFEFYNDWPHIGNGGNRLFPVEIDNKWQYDFIGFTNEELDSDTSRSTFFQVLDPPFQREICSIKTGECNPMVQMMNDITTKPEGYAKTVFSSKMLLDGVREATRGSNLMYNYTEGSSILGYSSDINDEYGFFIAQLDGTSTGGVVGFDFDYDNLHTGVYYVDNTLEAQNDTIWYGTGTADVDYNSINTFTEFAFNKDNFVYTVGAGFAYTTVQSFTEHGSAYDVKVNSFTMLDMTVFADIKYITQSNFGTTAFGVGLDHYQSLSTTDINFADYLKYEFNDRLTVVSADLVHSFGPLYFKASVNTESLNSYELGFILNL